MCTVGSNRTFMRRKGPAQTRMDRLREDLELTRKLEEKCRKFGLKSTSESLSVTTITKKFFPDANEIDSRNGKRTVDEVKPSRGRNFDGAPKVVHTRNEASKSPRKRSHGATRPHANDTNERFKSLEKRGKTRERFNEPPVPQRAVPNNVPSWSDEWENGFASQSSYKRSGRGIGPERIARARKSAMLRTKESVPRTSPNADAQPLQPSIQTRSQELPKEECTLNLCSPQSVMYNPSADDIDFEPMDVDFDMMDSFSSANGNEDSSAVISEKWLAEKEREVSSNVDEINRVRGEQAYQVRHKEFISDVDMPLVVPTGDILIVVDTNIFLSHLGFLNKLVKSSISNYKTHVIVAPWVVIQELDYVTKKKDEQLTFRAKRANHFIYDCMKKNNPKFFGQSFDDFKFNFGNAVSVDDFLHQYCSKLISMRNDVVLLTDDKNLCNKCMFSNVKVFTRDDFEKTFDINPL